MYSISLKHCPPANFISHVASTQKIKSSHDNISLPSLIAEGYMKAFTFQDGIECMVSDYRFKEDFHLRKFPLLWEFFILRIDLVSRSVNRVVMVNRKYDDELNAKKHTLVLLSSLEEFTFVASKNSHVKTLEIFIPSQWLYKKLNMQNAGEVLKTYLNFKNRNGRLSFITPSFTSQCTGIIASANTFTLDIILFEKNINLLLNNFISNLRNKLKELSNERKIQIVNEEIRRLMEVKTHLVRDLSVPPPFSSLINIAAMSSTSLKTKFKKMYGINIYEYFQKTRMEKARILLLSLQYSVKDVGHRLGYINLSNFSIAFKKEFDCLPGKFVQYHKDLSLQTPANNNSW